jgi:protein-S-isoprenylcysteine O-methyltransferase Ste14
MPVFRFAGGILMALGVVGLLDSFIRFAVQGAGTPAPVFPTRHLVVTGLYRYVRNPMYVAVVSAILCQALVFGNVHAGRIRRACVAPVSRLRAAIRRTDSLG